MGLRWPAEWEPHAATWLCWPHNPETWPDHLPEARREFAELVRAVAAREPVELLVPDAEAERDVRARLGSSEALPVRFWALATDDSWLRDCGPVFVEAEDGAPRILDFGFDAWGGKYRPFDLDAAVPRRLADALGVPRLEPGFVLEAGAIDGNGRGSVLTTESCLLHANRGPGNSREEVEARLARWLGARQLHWLAAGIAGDDTDGHVDDVARFVAPDLVVAAVEDDPGDPNFEPLRENLRRLRAARDPVGRPLRVATLPMPPPHVLDGQRTPASYANFYLANAAAIVPTFGAASDERALAVLQELLPDRDVVGVPCRTLVLGLGAVHCLSQQQPASSRNRCGDSLHTERRRPRTGSSTGQ